MLGNKLWLDSRAGRGFTLVELIVVIVVAGIVGVSFWVFMRPMLDAYFSAQRGADLSDVADTALRRMTQELRAAVPNSINLVSNQCLQFVPTYGGGRYRVSDDGTGTSQYPDNQPLTSEIALDLLAYESGGVSIAVNDYLVVGNMANAYYEQSAATSPWVRYSVTQVIGAPPQPSNGVLRLKIKGNPKASVQSGISASSGRFLLVAASEKSVMYSCSNGRLLRTVLTEALATSCQTSGVVIATNVDACDFVSAVAPSGTGYFGIVSLFLRLKNGDDQVSLSYGVTVDNVNAY